MTLHLDTHAVVWLYEGETTRFTTAGLALIERSALYYSPMVLLELQFLNEIGRIVPSANKILTTLNKEIGLEIAEGSFGQISQLACSQTWTRDPFDRIILSHAKENKAKLLTKDRKILKNARLATW